MKHSLRYIVMTLSVVFFIPGCSKQPLQEINAAKAAVDSIISEGAEKYLPADAKKINDDLKKAMDEVNAQDAKIFKNYGKAKEMLAAVKTEAESINSKLPEKMEEAKKAAITAMKDAKTAIDEIKALLEKASKGKGPKAASITIIAEVNYIEDSFKELQMHVDREDYVTISAKADELRNMASEWSALLKQPQAKTEKKKK